MTIFTRATHPWNDMRPMTWWPTGRSKVEKAAGKHGKSAVIRDPYGHWGPLNEFDIEPDGTVLLTVECMEPGCAFLDYIKLEGWQP